MSDRYGNDEVRYIDAPEEKHQQARERAAGGSSFGFLSIEDFARGERTTTVELDLSNGRVGVLNVTYVPDLMTDALTDQIQQLAEDGDTLAAAEVFCQVVTGWGFRGPLTANIIATDAAGKVLRDDEGKPLWKRDEIVPAGAPVPIRPETVQYIASHIIVGIWRGINEEVNGGKSKKPQKRSRRR